MTPSPVYVSITGLKLKAFYHAPRFWGHALRAMAQAQSAPGCLQAGSRTINGIHHTRTVWSEKSCMQAYLITGAHLDAMTSFHAFATGKTIGFETRDIPDWNDVHRIWLERGVDVGPAASEY